MKTSLQELMPTLFGYYQVFSDRAPLRHRVRTLYRLLRHSCRSALTYSEHIQEGQHSEAQVLFFKSMQRADYAAIFESVYRDFPDPARIIEVDQLPYLQLKDQTERHYPPSQVLRRCIRFFISFVSELPILLRSKQPKQRFSTALYLYLLFLRIRMDVGDLLQGQDKLRAVVLFSEMQPLERVLSYLCKQQGIPCCTLQHGLYAEYKQTHTINQWNYQPKFVDAFLAWGAATAELVQKYAPEIRTPICGKPLPRPEPISGESDPVYAFLLIFDQPLFQKQNQDLFDLVQKLWHEREDPRPIAVKLHPHDDAAVYELAGAQILNESRPGIAATCIGHTSSFLVDLLLSGERMFIYDSGAECIEFDHQIRFKNLEELKERLSRPYPEEQVQCSHLIACMGGESRSCHHQAIQALYPMRETSSIP